MTQNDEVMDSNRNEASAEPHKSPVWGFWGTLLWGLGIGGVFVLVQVTVVSVYMGMVADGRPQASLKQAATDGDMLAWATIASAFICTFLTFIAVAFKKGSNLRDYLGLYPVAMGQVIRWTLLFIALLIGFEVVTSLLDRPVTPEVMREVYLSADSKLLLFVATVVAASFFEELFFRGFLLEGFSRTALRPAGAVVLSAAFWSLVHVQYDAYGIATIFIIGIFFGLAKLRSGSTLFAMALHALNNAIAFAFLMALAGE